MSDLQWALGLMSGTSRDGIDAALIRSDGASRVEPGPSVSRPYPAPFRERLAEVTRGAGDAVAVERELTDLHAEAALGLLAEHGIEAGAVRVLGFHGHTVRHEPAAGRTWQIGDGSRLAALTRVDVVNDFRSADVAAGGQGAPLAPLYHAARATESEKPLAVLNLGGVANVTWLGPDGRIIAFDTGPANALIDDLVAARTGRTYDADGALAAAGCVDRVALAALMDHPYFDETPPKSLDRDAFDAGPVSRLPTEDAVATLVAFTAQAVHRALEHLPDAPRRWLVTGGGRHNRTLMNTLARTLGVACDGVEAVGWNGDALEAEAFAYLALRSLSGLPLSLPETTGVPAPTAGGRFHPAP